MKKTISVLESDLSTMKKLLQQLLDLILKGYHSAI